jgi:hypothetical protein
MALVPSPPSPLNRLTIRFRLTATVKHGNLARNRFDCPDDGAEWSMRRATFTIAATFLCSAAAAAPLVTYESPCECKDYHGKQRWAEKNDPALPPTDAGAIQAVTPSDIFNWQGPTEVPSSERIWSEQKWYALTGRVVELRAEEDGDLHTALAGASGDKPGMVVAEIPAKAEWCELRKIVFGWTEVQFRFRVRSGRKLKLTQPPVITVIGKAFFDIGHAPADHSNRRSDLQRSPQPSNPR